MSRTTEAIEEELDWLIDYSVKIASLITQGICIVQFKCE